MAILGEPEPRGGRRGPLVVALLVAAAIGVGTWLLLHRAPPEAPPTAAVTPRPTPRATATPAPVPGASTGTLHVEASVPGAQVSVDGRELGPAPQETELRPGPHRLRVVKDGFEPFEREVHVVPGHTARVSARLEAPAPRLRVDADVLGANVFLDRKFLGTTPLETRDVAPGSHRLNVSAEGYDMYAETIDVGAGSREVMVRFKEVRLDETLPVTHKHAIGSCRGTLIATTSGLRYDTTDANDAFSTTWKAVEPLQVDYLKKNLRVKVKAAKTYNFTAASADALLSFQKAVEAARKRL